MKLMNKYRSGLITAGVVNNLLGSWIVRLSEEYLAQQIYLQPFPDKLSRLPDSGRRRN